MSKEIETRELSRIPFVDTTDIQGRALLLCPFLTEEGEWRGWLPSGDGQLIETTIRPVESEYYAKSPERDDDIYFHFLNLLVKHSHWPEVGHRIRGIIDDLHNLGAIVEKLNLFAEHRRLLSQKARRYAATEVEYLVTVCRSLLDLLQQLIATLWNNKIKLINNDGELVKTSKPLPTSFRKMVFHDNSRMSVDDIKARYDLVQPLAEFYLECGPFFEILRSYRDHIIHHSSQIPMVFPSDDGFEVPTDRRPFSTFDCWKDKDIKTNGLASLDNAVAYLIFNTLAICNEFSLTMQSNMGFPSDMIPGFNIYVRGPHNGALLRMQEVFESRLPEEGSEP